MSKSNKPSDILERMRQTATREKPIQQEGVAIEEEDLKPIVEEKKIRFTLDLNKSQHRFLKLFALEAESDASVVVRTLIKHLENDSQLAESIQVELAN